MGWPTELSWIPGRLSTDQAVLLDMFPIPSAAEVLSGPIPVAYPGPEIDRVSTAIEVRGFLVGDETGGANSLTLNYYRCADGDAEWKDNEPFATQVVSMATGTVPGAELVTNGAFAADTNWTKDFGWTIAAGVATFDGATAGAGQSLSQSVTIAAANTYHLLTLDVSGGTFDDNNLDIYLGNQLIGITKHPIPYRFSFKAAASGAQLLKLRSTLRDTAFTVFNIDNVSLKLSPQLHFSSLLPSLQNKGDAGSGIVIGVKPSVDFIGNYLTLQYRRYYEY